MEARIGELLGPAVNRGPATFLHAGRLDKNQRMDFRTIAAAVKRGLLKYEDVGVESPWRASRRALLLDKIGMGGLKDSASVEWYTPARYIEAAAKVLGDIDLDPASSKKANKVVGAAKFYSEADDGLSREWHGRVWLNPPYGKGSGLFTTKLVEEYDAGNVTAAILLLNAYGFDSAWFQPLWQFPICFTDHRIVFTSPTRGEGGPANANIFVYLGKGVKRFASTFADFGTVVRAI